MKKLLLACVLCSPILAGAQSLAKAADQNGCGHLFAAVYVPRIATLTWSGACKDGLGDGFGVREVTEAGQRGSRYSGVLAGGRPHGVGTLTSGDETRAGDFVDGSFVKGTLQLRGKKFFHGTFEQGAPSVGTFHFDDGLLEGEFDRGFPDTTTGANIRRGTFSRLDGTPVQRFENGRRIDLPAYGREIDALAAHILQQQREQQATQELLQQLASAAAQYAQQRQAARQPEPRQQAAAPAVPAVPNSREPGPPPVRSASTGDGWDQAGSLRSNGAACVIWTTTSRPKATIKGEYDHSSTFENRCSERVAVHVWERNGGQGSGNLVHVCPGKKYTTSIGEAKSPTPNVQYREKYEPGPCR